MSLSLCKSRGKCRETDFVCALSVSDLLLVRVAGMGRLMGLADEQNGQGFDSRQGQEEIFDTLF